MPKDIAEVMSRTDDYKALMKKFVFTLVIIEEYIDSLRGVDSAEVAAKIQNCNDAITVLQFCLNLLFYVEQRPAVTQSAAQPEYGFPGIPADPPMPNPDPAEMEAKQGDTKRYRAEAALGEAQGLALDRVSDALGNPDEDAQRAAAAQQERLNKMMAQAVEEGAGDMVE